MKNTLSAIARTPTAYSIRYQANRQANFDIFSYIAHFFIDVNTMVVSAILYGGRDPGLAKQRVNGC